MKRTFYLPRIESEKVIWLKNFAAKLPAYEALLNLSPSEISSVANDAANIEYVLNLVNLYREEWKERAAFKKLMIEGMETGLTITLPTPPLEPAVPDGVMAPGIIPRVRRLVNRIKNHPNYTTVIGFDLGIIGSEASVNFDLLKPVISASLAGGNVVIAWQKGAATGLDIYVDRGSGYQFLTTDTQPDFIDAYKLADGQTAAKWKYKARYRSGDEQVGNWSDEVQIAVINEIAV